MNQGFLILHQFHASETAMIFIAKVSGLNWDRLE
jgi:hypothetical protein